MFKTGTLVCQTFKHELAALKRAAWPHAQTNQSMSVPADPNFVTPSFFGRRERSRDAITQVLSLALHTNIPPFSSTHGERLVLIAYSYRDNNPGLIIPRGNEILAHKNTQVFLFACS